jgi:hypothetical protein
MGRRQCLAVSAITVFLTLACDPIALGQATDDETLRMSKPVLCRKVHGFASFEEWQGATLTADDKLMIYSEPSGHKIEQTREGYRAHLVEDGRIRRKGEKATLWKKENMLEYEAKSKFPPYRIYFRTDVAIKGLPPGDYEIDLTLRDRLSKDDAKVVRTLPFTVVAPETKGKKEGPVIQLEERPATQPNA